MNIIYFQTPLTSQEYRLIREEFYQFHILNANNKTPLELSSQEWKRVEVFYGNKITPKELKKASQLHWIHSPSPFLNKLCIDEISKDSSIILTFTNLAQMQQIKEYMQASVLAFAKQILNHQINTPAIKMPWLLKNKIFLQVGLNPLGKTLAQGAKELGCNVWGAAQHITVYKECDKTVSLETISEILPKADIISLTLSPFRQSKINFGEKEFNSMKNDSILIILGSRKYINEQALYNIAEKGKFRGIIIDGLEDSPVSNTHPLINQKNTLITRNLAPQPAHKDFLSFRTFRYNLRQFIKGNHSTMKNIVREYQTE